MTHKLCPESQVKGTKKNFSDRGYSTCEGLEMGKNLLSLGQCGQNRVSKESGPDHLSSSDNVTKCHLT